MTEKYICYCETNVKKLDESLAALKEEIPQIESSLKGAVSMKAQVEEEYVPGTQMELFDAGWSEVSANPLPPTLLNPRPEYQLVPRRSRSAWRR